MSHRVVVSVSVAAVLVALVLSPAVPSTAQTSAAKKAPVPRTAWGKPDLQGVWDFRTITPLERPQNQAGREFLTEAEAAKLEQATEDRNEELLVRPAERAPVGGNVDRRPDGTPGFYNNFWLDQGTKTIGTRRTSLIIDPPEGRLPALMPSAQRRAEARQQYLKEHPADSWLDRSASDRCIEGFNAGPPINPGGYNQNMQIFQTPTHVALLTEMVHNVRIVPLDGQSSTGSGVRQWAGTSRGRWDGDTLIVETSNFKEERRWRNATGNMKLVERFRRIDPASLEYTYTVTDPETWTRPWTATIPMRRGDLPLYEYACHEGNYSLYNILSGYRAEEKEAAAKTRR
jgi:hypothetical protein